MEREQGRDLTLVKKIDRGVFNVFKGLSYDSAVALIAVAVLCTANVLTK